MYKATLPNPILVGRKIELEELEQFLNSALKGKGSTLLISGTAGSGKTRLISEFLKKAKKKGVVVLAGWCLSEATVPYFPFVEAFDSYIAMREGEGTSATNQKMSLKSWLSANDQFELNEPNMKLPPQAWKDLAFHGVTEELMFLSAKKPLILFLDDIHWADSASLSLLHYLAYKVSSERILILATFRIEELNADAKGRPSQLSKILFSMGRQGLFKQIRLSNLGKDEVKRIAESMLKGNVHPKIVKKLASDSRGNPLFVVESLRMLYQQKNLCKKDGLWNLCIEKYDVPEKVKDVILGRMEALTPLQRKILDVASVFGEKFDPKIVAAAVKQDYADVLIALNDISKRTLMVQMAGDSFRFEHDKVREMLYKEVPPLLKREYHLRIAEEMESQNLCGNKFTLGELAYHFVHAESNKAVEYCLQAGKEALSRFSNAQAIDYFSFIVKSTENSGEFIGERESALEGLGDAYAANGMYAEAIKIFDQLAESEGGSFRLRALRKGMEAAFIKGDKPDILLAYAQKAEEIALDDRLEMGRVISNRGRAYAWAGRGERNQDLEDYATALRIFKEENSLPDIAEALWRIGEASLDPEGIGYLLLSRAIFREMGDLRKEIVASRSIGTAFIFLSLFQEAKQELCIVMREAEKIGAFDELARAIGMLGLLDTCEEKYEEAIAKVLKALKYIEKTDVDYVKSFDLGALTRIYCKLGDLDRADEYFQKMKKLPPEVLSTGMVQLTFALAKGVYFAAKGRFKESDQVFEALPTPYLENTPFIREYIWALEKQGKNKEADVQKNKAKEKIEQNKLRLKHGKVQTNIVAPRKLQVGEEFELHLYIVNIATNPGSLVKVDGLLPYGSKVISLPSFCSKQNNSVNMNKRQIGPFQVEKIKIRMAFTIAGVYCLKPSLDYTNELGDYSIYRAEPLTIEVMSISEEKSSSAELLKGKPEFKSEAAEKVFNYLVTAFKNDYLRRKMQVDKCGWRTLMEIAKNAKVTMYSMYGRSGRGGKATKELIDLDVVESRFFLGERGRGGRVFKMRICHGKNLVEQKNDQDRIHSNEKRPQ